MPKEFAVGSGTKVTLWCRDLGNGRGRVINGDWYWPDDVHTSVQGVGEIVWRGEVPEPFNHDYNEAIPWIEQELDNH